MACLIECEILYFAQAREAAGAARESVSLPCGKTLADLESLLRDRHPALAPLLPACAFAVDEVYRPRGFVLERASRVAVIPPVSGG